MMFFIYISYCLLAYYVLLLSFVHFYNLIFISIALYVYTYQPFTLLYSQCLCLLSFPLIQSLLVGVPGSPVTYINDPNPDKTASFQGFLHGFVVCMGIRTEVIDSLGDQLLFAEGRCLSKHTMDAAVASQSVDGPVGLLVQPGSVLYQLVRWILADEKSEYKVGLILLIHPDEALSGQKIILQLLLRSIPLSPLGLIPVDGHLFSPL